MYRLTYNSVSLIIAAFISQSAAAGITVTQEQYGEKWPFTVESGEVDCVRGSAAIFIHNGNAYQLNGMASQLGYRAIDPIWRDDPKMKGLKINIGPMISLALKQCK